MKKFIKTKFPFLIPILKPVFNEITRMNLRFVSKEKIFTGIYENNKWGDKESRSGPGSNLKQTKTIRSELVELLKEYKIRSILDIPCGDFFWMKEVSLDSITYVGGDIVKKIIQENIKNYSKENRKFVKMDIINNEIPQTDLILCRDLLIHFSYNDIFRAIKNIKKSNSKYLLTTSFESTQNQDILTGEWHPINLRIKPFNFSKPLKEINENQSMEKAKGKKLILFKISDL